MFIEKEKLINILEEAFKRGYEGFLECKNEYVQQVLDDLEEEEKIKNNLYTNPIQTNFDNFANSTQYGNVITTNTGVEFVPNYSHDLTYNQAMGNIQILNSNLDNSYYNNTSL